MSATCEVGANLSSLGHKKDMGCLQPCRYPVTLSELGFLRASARLSEHRSGCIEAYMHSTCTKTQGGPPCPHLWKGCVGVDHEPAIERQLWLLCRCCDAGCERCYDGYSPQAQGVLIALASGGHSSRLLLAPRHCFQPGCTPLSLAMSGCVSESLPPHT